MGLGFSECEAMTDGNHLTSLLDFVEPESDLESKFDPDVSDVTSGITVPLIGGKVLLIAASSM